MIKFNDAIGKDILSSEEGKIIGNVAKVVLNSKNWKIIGYVVEMLDGKDEKYLMIEDVASYEKDTTVIASKEKLKNINDLMSQEDFVNFGKELVGVKVKTTEGKEIGELSSFHFNEKNGEITHYELSEGTAKDLIEGKSIFSADGVVSISPETVVVKKVVDEITDTMKAEPGLKQKISKTKAETKIKAKEAVRKIKDKLDLPDKK